MKQKVATNYNCENCDYHTSRKCNWEKHLLTRKHKILTDTDAIATKSSNIYKCECGKVYNHRQSLFTHRKKCTTKKEEKNKIILKKKEPDLSNISNLENLSNSELISLMHKMIPKLGNTNNSNNNNTINIQVFLDEKCKDAMTIQNFAKELTMTIDDLMNHKKKGLTQGVSNILIENLKPIPIMERPLHCTDIKKSKWMINDAAGGWQEDNGNSVIKEAGFGINKRFQDVWNDAYPDWQYNENLRNMWMELVSCLTADPSEKEIEKTLKKIGPECKLTIDDIRKIMKE
tara:strand:- start:3611 stop:4474 length:864 start_codon:yes stop_codon:yes gene_type:complete